MNRIRRRLRIPVRDTLDDPALDAAAKRGLWTFRLREPLAARVVHKARKTLRSEQWVVANFSAKPAMRSDFVVTDAVGQFGGLIQPSRSAAEQRSQIHSFDGEVQLAGPHRSWFVIRDPDEPLFLLIARAVFLPLDPRYAEGGVASMAAGVYGISKSDRWAEEAAQAARERPNDAMAQFRYGRYLAETSSGDGRTRGLALIERAIDLDRSNTLFARTWLSLSRPETDAERNKADNFPRSSPRELDVAEQKATQFLDLRAALRLSDLGIRWILGGTRNQPRPTRSRVPRMVCSLAMRA